MIILKLSDDTGEILRELRMDKEISQVVFTSKLRIRNLTVPVGC